MLAARPLIVSKRSTSFQSFVQQIYTFFSASTHRWAIPVSAIDNAAVAERLSDTRLEVHAMTTSDILVSYESIIEALIEIYDDNLEKGRLRTRSLDTLRSYARIRDCINARVLQ